MGCWPTSAPDNWPMAEEGNLGTVAWREVLAETTARMDEAGLPIVEARWIVEEAGGLDPTDEGSGLDDLVTERGMFRHDDLLRRRMAGEPLQYVFGHWSFRTLDLMVDPRVLIPRPETEAVVGHALDEFHGVVARRHGLVGQHLQQAHTAGLRRIEDGERRLPRFASRTDRIYGPGHGMPPQARLR